MKLYAVVVILSMLCLPLADTQEEYWPVHTACDSDTIKVIYSSCEYIFTCEHEDPIQDVGFMLSSCKDIRTQPYAKVSFLLRQSIDEFYLSVELFLNGVWTLHHDEPICLPNFPRFTFCGNRRGEMITIQASLPGLEIPLKGHYNFKIHGINQNGFQIGCVNATAIFL